MNVLIATDFDITLCENRYYYKNQIATIVLRYYEAFGTLNIISRVSNEDSVSGSYTEVTEMIKSVIATPSLTKVLLGKYNAKICDAVKKNDLIIARCPGIISHYVAEEAYKQRKPYFTETMGCAWDAYWNHSLTGKIIAPYMFFKMKTVVKHADFALYVTNEFLQKRYPCDQLSVSASNVLLKEVSDDVLKQRLKRISCMDKKHLTIMTTAAVDVRYKGQEYMIKAIPLLNKEGIRIKYLLVGGGSQNHLESIARKYGVLDQIEFLGRLSLEDVFSTLDNVDIYVQPSLQEGLPRSMIEAMSRGCPCIGARTAGIPELVDDFCVVKRKSTEELKNAIMLLLQDENLKEVAMRNHTESKKYISKRLDSIRNEFFNRIKQDGKKNNDD